jgi:23S rRNA (pseudouridine1915-N3)-methyltransferase
MKIQFWNIGKPHESFVKEGIELFTKRVTNYYPAEWKIINPPKISNSLTTEQVKEKEASVILPLLEKSDYLVLLDETGKMLNSIELAQFITQRTNESTKQVIFLIGGAYGVSEEIKKRANFTWSLSKLVFPHHLVRLILSEQIYRACSIIKNEKYHHI